MHTPKLYVIEIRYTYILTNAIHVRRLEPEGTVRRVLRLWSISFKQPFICPWYIVNIKVDAFAAPFKVLSLKYLYYFDSYGISYVEGL